IARVFRAIGGGKYPPDVFIAADRFKEHYVDGHARASLPVAGGSDALQVRARFPGAAGNRRVRFTIQVGQNMLAGEPGQARVSGLLDWDVVWIRHDASPVTSPPGGAGLYLALFDHDEQTWRFLTAKQKSAGDL